jgi:hypothetical protein
MKIKQSDITLYLSTKSEFYKAGWKAADKGMYRKEPEGDNPFYAEYESGYEDCISSGYRASTITAPGTDKSEKGEEKT